MVGRRPALVGSFHGGGRAPQRLLGSPIRLTMPCHMIGAVWDYHVARRVVAAAGSVHATKHTLAYNAVL
jgi:hypothetical protein